MAILAVLDEIHQMYVPGRSAEAADWVADVSGAALGMILCRAVYRRRKLAV
ncbi:MAG: VanZ family protein [Deltaproteobacteria bacterium]|nr:VanZ family protein [Deltaproteobacteria bacterium]